MEAAYFLALKLEAFTDRGNGDFLHKDVEDIISLVSGRDELLPEITASEDSALKAFIKARIGRIKSGLLDNAQGHLGGGAGDRMRLPIVRSRLERLANL